MKKISKLIMVLFLLVLAIPLTTESISAYDDGCNQGNTWVREGKEWKYCKSFYLGYAKNEVQRIDGDIYAFNNSGYMIKNSWFYDTSSWTQTWKYLGTDGKAINNAWKKINNSWYYFDNYADMLSSQTISVNGLGYYLNSSGRMVTDTWTLEYGDWYYSQSDGVFATGWKQINGQWYYFTPYTNGKNKMLSNSYKTIDGKSYYFDDKGYMITNRWLNSYSGWRFFGDDGSAVRGWHKFGQKWAYFDDSYVSNGAVAVQDQAKTINGKVYIFDSKGYMITDGWTKGTYGDWYYLRSDGSAITGWHLVNGSWYFFSEVDGRMYKDRTSYIDGKYYRFNASGRLY